MLDTDQGKTTRQQFRYDPMVNNYKVHLKLQLSCVRLADLSADVIVYIRLSVSFSKAYCAYSLISKQHRSGQLTPSIEEKLGRNWANSSQLHMMGKRTSVNTATLSFTNFFALRFIQLLAALVLVLTDVTTVRVSCAVGSE